ncbi:hypothetical protein Pint_22658 [Pistacia integerrima]|uniref:Uncharacterized protein n=1 Tax=Pistacia integerrima TaxID=434235 RepID=A0ACC0YJ46_9ROSI|nr:hypothetical protein Pint_22658 [Pistacia integerrima]
MYDLQFGDHDGTGSEVLLQHPLAVFCAKDGQIYFADSYNHKIKKLDPASKRVSTLAGTGKAGFKDGAALAAQVRKIICVLLIEFCSYWWLRIWYMLL